MKDQISRFMLDCPEAKKQTLNGNPFAKFVSTEIPEAIFDSGLVDREKYQISGSVGAGVWAYVPWIGIFDKSITTSATKGIYIVYLLSEDSKRLYLTFNQGCTEIKNKVKSTAETKRVMQQNAEEIRSYTNPHGFIAKNDIHLGDHLTSLGKFYEIGTIYYKQYDADAIPSEEELRQDLSDMMDIYKQYADHLNNKNDDKNGNDGWLPLLSEYDPGITKEKWLELLNDSAVFKPTWCNVLAKFFDFGGEASCKQIESNYGGQWSTYNMTCTAIAKKVHQLTQCPLHEGSFYAILFFYKYASSDEEGSVIWKIRPELYQALSEFDVRRFLDRSGVFDSWTIIDDDTAIKDCDRSFFEYHGSGVPKGISWFFGADDLAPGQVVNLKLRYLDNDYDAQVRNESSNRRRVRIFWNADLGREFAKCLDKLTYSEAIFHRIGENAFKIVMRIHDDTGREETIGEEMTVREKLAAIEAYIEAKGFTYNQHLIENLYLSLKSKPFVILAGTSGTGKTRLVRFFSEAIGATEENGRYLQIAVRPDWSDSTDLFGHVNLNGKFVPGKILEFIWEAQRNKEKPFIMCLDEMNLARVEYYLSDFLSVIETRDLKDGEITTDALISEKDYGLDEESFKKYGEIRFPENLYIVGTVNMDETTFPFSKKVLDRANTIEFNYVDLHTRWQDAVAAARPLAEDNSFLRSNYVKLIECPKKWRVNVSGISAELEKYNQILKKANAHVGYRVRDEIVFYLINNLESGALNENEAMDNEILQKILPRIQGSSASVKSMLCELFHEIAGDYEGYQTESNDTAFHMMDILARNEGRIKYEKSAAKIAFMVRRFEEDGFTSYWL